MAKIITLLCLITVLYGLFIFRNLLFVLSVDSGFVLSVDSGVEEELPDTSNLELLLDDLYAYDGELNKEILRVHDEPFLGFSSVEMVISREKELISNVRDYLLSIQNETDSFRLVLHRQTESYINQLESKLHLVERYNSSLRAYRAVEKFFPIIKKQLLKDIQNRKIKNDSSYISLVESIYNQVQRFIATPDPQRRDNILTFIEKSEVKLNNISPVFKNANEFVLKSTEFIESKTLSNELLSALFSASVSAYREIKITLNSLDRTVDTPPNSDLLNGVRSQLWTLVSLFALFALCIFYFIGYAAKQTFALSISTSLPIDRLDSEDDRYNHTSMASSDDMLINTVTSQAVPSKKRLDSNSLDKEESEYTLESLAMMLSHQIQTPLQHVNNNINALCPMLENVHVKFDQLEKDFSDGSILSDSITALVQSSSIAEFPFTVSEIKKGIMLAQMAADNVRHLSNSKSVNKIRLNLNEVITQVVNMKASSLRSTANINVKLASEATMISAVKIDVHHLLDCLITNAIESIDATPPALGKIEITTIVQDNAIKLLVRDNGVGMSKEVLGKIYEPFFSTKKTEPGTGIGLTMAKRHVERYDGKIDVVSEEKTGTIVRVIFPYSYIGKNTTYDVMHIQSKTNKRQAFAMGKDNANVPTNLKL